MSEFNTDKITVHGYLPAYRELAERLGPAARVCELGVLNGESLRLWQHLFPDGEILGVDHNENAIWPQGTVRVVSFHDDAALPRKLGGTFDLIIDDGNHYGPTVTKSFSILWPLVRPGGYYVIEDWMVSLRPGERQGETWRAMDDGLMLTAISRLLYLLKYPDSECFSVEYRYGLAIVRKRSSE